MGGRNFGRGFRKGSHSGPPHMAHLGMIRRQKPAVPLAPVWRCVLISRPRSQVATELPVPSLRIPAPNLPLPAPRTPSSPSTLPSGSSLLFSPSRKLRPPHAPSVIRDDFAGDTKPEFGPPPSLRMARTYDASCRKRILILPYSLAGSETKFATPLERPPPPTTPTDWPRSATRRPLSHISD